VIIDEFLAGKPFTIKNLPYDQIKYCKSDEKLIYFINNQVIYQSGVIFSNKNTVFSVLLPLFGLIQCLTIPYSYCEEVTDRIVI